MYHVEIIMGLELPGHSAWAVAKEVSTIEKHSGCIGQKKRTPVLAAS